MTPAEIWQKYDAIESRLTAGVSERMLDLAELRPGMRVLDVASGRGEMAVRAAQRGCSVLGIDISDSLLELARIKSSHIEFRAANAETFVGSGFDAAIERWGLMYMNSPVAALWSIRRALVPGGKLVAAFWAEPERVSYHTLPRSLLAHPLPPIDFEAPGVFRFADPARIHRDFALAGLTVEHIEEMDVAVIEGENAQEIVDWTLAFGMSKLLADTSLEEKSAWEARLVARLNGVFRLGGVTRIVVAR